MNLEKYILSIDQGTTGTTALVVNQGGDVCGQGYRAVREIYPNPGWVDQNPIELIDSCEYAILEALRNANVHPSECVSIGITNQRETTLVWEKDSGNPVSDAIVWECRRTSRICEELKSQGKTEEEKQIWENELKLIVELRDDVEKRNMENMMLSKVERNNKMFIGILN